MFRIQKDVASHANTHLHAHFLASTQINLRLLHSVGLKFVIKSRVSNPGNVMVNIIAGIMKLVSRHLEISSFLVNTAAKVNRSEIRHPASAETVARLPYSSDYAN